MSGPVAKTLAGNVRGIKLTCSEGLEFYGFKGIPFAKPPVGNLRFQDPKPLEPWTGIREAAKHGPTCAQLDLISNQIIGDDDCLYLNVYAKHFDDPKLRRPVMVWIHGGGFVCGSGDDSLYGADYFMHKDVVLVTINYRVAVLGFLNLDDEIAPGNQGLKDQVMALQWVRDNIANFGGDPNNVTIFGESAGGASVHYLCISPLARGLFHKAIAQSGVAFNAWAYHPPGGKKRAYQLCELLGFKPKDNKSIVDFLRTVEARKLIEAQEKILTKDEKIQFQFVFGPGIDDKSKNPFLPVHPEVLSEEGVQVPLLIGYNSREGIIFTREIGAQYPRFNKEFTELVHPNVKTLMEKYNLSPEDMKRIYLNNVEINEDTYVKLIDLLSDVHFVEGIHRVVKSQVQRSSAPTYLYRYTYDKDPSFVKAMYNCEMSGASHADELLYLFRAHLFDGSFEPLKKDTNGYKVKELMIELWTNFAIYGRPTPTPSKLMPFYWPPVSNEKVFRHLNICEDPRIEVTLNLEQHYTAHKTPKNKL